jgi:hypothetical protein
VDAQHVAERRSDGDRQGWIIRSHLPGDPQAPAWWSWVAGGLRLHGTRENAIRYESVEAAEARADDLKANGELGSYVVEELQ